MLIRWIRGHFGRTLDERGLDYSGRKTDVTYLNVDGDERLKEFAGLIQAEQCEMHSQVRLVGFTEYSQDDGVSWHKLDKNTYVIGVEIHQRLYVVLFNGLPRSVPYTPKEPTMYYNNVYDLNTYRNKR